MGAMSVKKGIFAVMMGTLLSLSTVAFASIPISQIALGNVHPGDSVASVRAAYGEPVYSDREKLIFSNGFLIKMDDDRPGIVEKVIVNENNGIATPGGVTVGMSESVLTSTYGMADKVDRDWYDTEYVYRGNERRMKLEFKVVDGIIVKISCELDD